MTCCWHVIKHTDRSAWLFSYNKIFCFRKTPVTWIQIWNRWCSHALNNAHVKKVV